MLEGTWEEVIEEYESRVRHWMTRMKKGGWVRRARLEKVPWDEDPWKKSCRASVLTKYQPQVFVHPLTWDGEFRKPRPIIDVVTSNAPTPDEARKAVFACLRSTPAYYKALANESGTLMGNAIVGVTPFHLRDQKGCVLHSLKAVTYPRMLWTLETAIITGVEDIPGTEEARAMEIDELLAKATPQVAT